MVASKVRWPSERSTRSDHPAPTRSSPACAIARGYVATRGVDLVVRPGFVTVQMPDMADRFKNVDITAVVFIINIG